MQKVKFVVNTNAIQNGYVMLNCHKLVVCLLFILSIVCEYGIYYRIYHVSDQL